MTSMKKATEVIEFFLRRGYPQAILDKSLSRVENLKREQAFKKKTKSGNVERPKNLKDELLAHGDYNVIIVDWSDGNSPPYTQATANTRVVGAQIGLLVDELIKYFLSRGLYCGSIDPAGPYFENTDPVVRLDPTDAVFVDVIHSDAPPLGLLQLGLGIKQAVGHLDFYPNLGRDQPGCTRNPFTQIAQWGLVEGQCNELIKTSVNS
uniref:Lipase domain-containing protein n=1 Tax=Biomphalaria glabrata TaxID=6526 RepID=A0A2C9M1Z3_BIOGL